MIKYMHKKVLVTGGTGFIGKNTLTPLLNKDFEVHVTTSKPTLSLPKNIFLHSVDLLNCEEHHNLIKQIQPTHLLHTAWYTENGKFWDAPENVFWLKATISLAQAFFQEGGLRFVGLGTCAEYDWEEGICIEGKTKELPTSLYGKIKKSTFECLNALASFQNKSFSWARIFFPYGPYESEKRLIPYVIRQLLRNNEAQCTHGNQIRDFLHVFDIADAIVTLLDSDLKGIVNIGSGIPIQIKDIITYIGMFLDKPYLINFGSIKEPPYSPKKIVADNSQLKSLGWSQKYSIEKGLQQNIHWWQETDIIHI